MRVLSLLLVLQTISLEFRQAEIVNVLRAIAKVGKMNILIDEEVKGKITVSLRNVEIPKAFSRILEIAGLVAVEKDGLLSIMPKEKHIKMMKLARRHESEVSRKLAKTFYINFADPKGVARRLKLCLSPSGRIQRQERRIVIFDVESSLECASSLVKKLDRRPAGILIEAKIAEVSTSALRNVGIEWKATGKLGSAQVEAESKSAEIAPLFRISFGIVGDRSSLEAALLALEREGKAKIISSPRITTLENREAVISQGFKIPYETISEVGVHTQFFDAALELKVKPRIADEEILLEIFVSRNYPDFSIRSARGVPSISKNEASTTVTVEPGKTVGIGGIYITENSESTVEVPILGKLPILGWLFRSKKFKKESRELVIFITPSVVNFLSPSTYQ